MAEPLGWCVDAVRAAAEPGLARALLALRTRHTRRPGGAARFRERGGLGPLLELLGPERPRRTLDLALSVLGNCCTEPGCRRQARRLGGVPRLVALLSLPAPESVRNRVARTLANLALEPDGAQDVLDAGAAPLLVSLAASCATPGCLLSAARALRILGATPAPRRALARAGAVRALAARLAALPPAHPACLALARALRGLTDPPGPWADEVAPALPALAALAAHAKRDHRQPALAAIAAACARAPLRPALGAAGAVEAVAQEVGRLLGGSACPPLGFPGGAGPAVRALCLLCREAVNRARVRAAGGLGLLLRLLAEPLARAWRPRVLLALAAFAYDQEALADMEAQGIVPLLADVLRARARGKKEEEEEEEDEAAASCDLPREPPGPPGTGAAAGSLRGLKSWLLSEAASPPPSPPPPPPCPLSPPRRRLPPMGALALPRGVGEGDPWLPEAPALLLLGRLAAADEPSRALATAPVVSGLLRYLTGVPAPAPRAARLLQRLTGHPAFLGTLIRAYVPSLLHSWLVLGLTPLQAEELSRLGGPRRPAAPSQPRQARLKELGEGLLRNLGAAAAAPFGVGLLTHMLRCGSPPARLACATALPLLARPASPVRGLLWGGGAVALLLSAVARGPVSPYEPPPAFALYAAAAIALLRGHGGDISPGDIPGDHQDTPGRAKDLQVHGDGDTKELWGHVEDLWGHGDSGDSLGENGDLQRPPDQHKDPWGHPDTFEDTENSWGHMDGHVASPVDGRGDTGDTSGCTDGHGDPWGHADGLGDPEDAWGPTGSPSALSPAALYPPPLLSPVSPSPQVSPDPLSPGLPGSQVSPRAAKRPRALSCPQLSPDPPNLHSRVAPRPPKCTLLSSPASLSSDLPNSCPHLSLRSSNPCSHLSPCPQPSPTSNPCPEPSPTSSNPCPQPSPSPQLSPTSSNPCSQPSLCPQLSPTSSNPCPQPPPCPQPSLCPQLSPTSSNSCPQPSLCPQLSPTSSSSCPQPSLCPQLSPTSSNSCPQPSLCPQLSPASSNSCPQSSLCPQLSPTSSNPCPQPSLCPQLSPTSSNPCPQPSLCPQLSPTSSNPCPQPSPSPQSSPTSSNPSPPLSPATCPPPLSPACPYAQTPHDLLLLPSGAHPGVPVAREALTRGSPVLGAMLGGAFAEAHQATVVLGCAPRRPLLLLLHFLHGCRGLPRDKCPLLSPPVPPGAAGAAVALARRYLVGGFEGVVAAAVAASPAALWALAERWACPPLAARAAQAILGGPPHEVAPRLVRVARLAQCPPRLARALMAAVAPGGAQPHLDMGEPWGGGDPLLRPPGDASGDLGDVPEDLGDLGDDFGVPCGDLGDSQGDLGHVAFGDPSVGAGDPLGRDDMDVEVKGPL